MFEWFVSIALMLFGGDVWSTDRDPVSPLATTTAQVVRVVDGDTIIVRLAGQEEYVRYIGIDTPEFYRDATPECYAAEAARANASLVADQRISLVRDTEDRDGYGRLLRYVYTDSVFVNETLVRNGYARVMPIAPNTNLRDDLYAASLEAQTADRGLWSACH